MSSTTRSEPFAQLAVIRPLPGHEQEVEKQLGSLVEAARTEPGTLVYVMHRRERAGGGVEFVFYEVFASKESFEVHAASATMAAFVEQAEGLLDGGISVERLEFVAGTTGTLPA